MISEDRIPVRALAVLVCDAQMNLKLSRNFDKMLLISLHRCNSLGCSEASVVSVCLLGEEHCETECTLKSLAPYCKKFLIFETAVHNVDE